MALRAGASSAAFCLWRRVGFWQPAAVELGTTQVSVRSLSARAVKGPVRFQPLQPKSSKKPPQKPAPSAPTTDSRQQEETWTKSYSAEGAPQSFFPDDVLAPEFLAAGLELEREIQGHGRKKGGGRRRLTAGRTAEDEAVREWPPGRLQPRRLTEPYPREASLRRGDAAAELAPSNMAAPGTFSLEEIETENRAHRTAESSLARGEYKPVSTTRGENPSEEGTGARGRWDMHTESVGRRTRRGLRKWQLVGNSDDGEGGSGRRPAHAMAERTEVIGMSPLTAGNVKEDNASWRRRILDAIDDGTLLASISTGDVPSSRTRDSAHANSHSPDTFEDAYSDTMRHDSDSWPVDCTLDEDLPMDSMRDSAERLVGQGPDNAGSEIQKAKAYVFRLLNTG